MSVCAFNVDSKVQGEQKEQPEPLVMTLALGSQLTWADTRGPGQKPRESPSPLPDRVPDLIYVNVRFRNGRVDAVANLHGTW